MAKQKSRSSRVSNGGRTKSNKNHEAKRQAKFAAKRENGTAYEYQENPYNPEKEPVKFAEENRERAEKTKSKKLPLARRISIFAKLNNEVAADKLREKEKARK